jgi:imidazole glycerol-phosphate synthase subunit HisH
MDKKLVCLLDYGSGNVKSVFNVLDFLGYNVKISNSEEDIRNCSHIILPGVGAFGSAMEKIKNTIPLNIVEEEVLEKGKLFLGICVGMQLLADRGKEFGDHKGLGWIPGVVDKIDSKELPSLHIGWNDIKILKDSPLFNGLLDFNDFYFVHSYCFEAKNKDNIIAQTQYESTFNSVISRDNIFGIQFHPEKSQKAGQLFLKNFLENL